MLCRHRGLVHRHRLGPTRQPPPTDRADEKGRTATGHHRHPPAGAARKPPAAGPDVPCVLRRTNRHRRRHDRRSHHGGDLLAPIRRFACRATQTVPHEILGRLFQPGPTIQQAVQRLVFQQLLTGFRVILQPVQQASLFGRREPIATDPARDQFRKLLGVHVVHPGCRRFWRIHWPRVLRMRSSIIRTAPAPRPCRWAIDSTVWR